MFREETGGRTEVVKRKLDEIQLALEEQTEVERRYYEDLLDRQIADIVRLEQRERKLANETTFLRARLERALRERDRAGEIEHSQRERDLIARLERQDTILSQHHERVGALQEALERTMARLDTEVRKKETEERKKAAREMEEMRLEWEEKLEHEKRAWGRERGALVRELEELRQAKKKYEDANEALGMFRRRSKALEDEVDRLKEEVAVRRRSEDKLRTRVEELEERAREWMGREKEMRELEFLRTNYTRLRDIDRKHVDELNRLHTELDRLRYRTPPTTPPSARAQPEAAAATARTTSSAAALSRSRSEEPRRGQVASRALGADGLEKPVTGTDTAMARTATEKGKERVTYMEEKAGPPVYAGKEE